MLKQTSPKNGLFTFTESEGVGTVVLDCPGEKVNKLTMEGMGHLSNLFEEIAQSKTLKVLVFTSLKPSIFIAGADIRMIQEMTDKEEAYQLVRKGQKILHQLVKLPFPTVAAINGACLGGGLELALACDFRVVSNSEKTQLGQPEVNLGILPGFGGTQRLPRLIGLRAALPMILSGKPVAAKKAYRLKLADAILSETFFESDLETFVTQIQKGPFRRSLLKRRQKKGLVRLFMDHSVIFTGFVIYLAKKDILKKTKGFYPAPLLALKSIQKGFHRPMMLALRVEARLFSELVTTPICKSLIQLFFHQDALKKEPFIKGSFEPRDIKRASVLGAGLMGGGIAWLFSHRVGDIRIKDLYWDSIQHSYQAAREIYSQLEKRRRVTPSEVTMKMHRISGTLEYTGLHHVDVVMEAIVESMGVKKRVLSDVEALVSDHTIIASNTSSLSITQMASDLKVPERFIGFHFFSPVNRMPLIEVIPGDKTSPEVVASMVAFARQLKKTPVVVKNCPGFLVNRVLLPYVSEAVFLIQDGVATNTIDALADSFGMPLGPLSLADEVGLDVGFKVMLSLEDGYGDRMKRPQLMLMLSELEEFYGKKSGVGFYTYSGKKKHVNPQVKQLVQELEMKKRAVPEEDILDRLFLILVNEAARCLEENVVSQPAYLDMAMVMGTGFPPFRGGVCAYADSLGIQVVVDRLKFLSEKYGSRFEPASLLVDMAKSGKTFY